MPTNYIPEGYHTLTPYISVKEPDTLVDFITQVLDAKERYALRDEAGNLGHGEYQIGSSVVMIGRTHDPWPESPCSLYVYVPDVDATYNKSLESGASNLMPPADQFYGDRHGGVTHSSGVSFWFATHIEDVSPEEMKRRAEQWTEKKATT